MVIDGSLCCALVGGDWQTSRSAIASRGTDGVEARATPAMLEKLRAQATDGTRSGALEYGAQSTGTNTASCVPCLAVPLSY